ncbi:tape measure protein [Chitinophaga sp. HK235]|uniref:tape measure protein n=1 Tax=Chitinophaga sp. HK235 TaxID=2952571 RepID=UPI001BA628F1|nr:tape measure protein [Chitinophaga sp. HK235]
MDIKSTMADFQSSLGRMARDMNITAAFKLMDVGVKGSEAQLDRLNQAVEIFTPGLQSLARISDDAGANIAASFTKATEEVDNLTDAFKDLQKVIKASNAAGNGRRGDGPTGRTEEADQELADGYQEAMGNIASVGLELLGKGLDIAMAKEQMNIEFKAAFGSQGGQMQQQVKKMADDTTFNMEDLAPNALALANAGTAVNDIVPTLGMLGDISGGSAEKMKALTEAYASIQTEGTLTKENLAALKSAGFDPLVEMTKVSGLSMDQLKANMEAGNISTSMIQESFKSATSTGGQYFGLMEEKASTLGGKWAMIQESFSNGLGVIGGAVLGVVGLFADFGMALKDGEIGAMLLAAGLGGLALILSWNAIVAGFNAIALGGLNLAMTVFNALANANPIMLIVTGLALLVGGLIYAYKHFEWFKKGVQVFFNVLLEAGKFVLNFLLAPLELFMEGIRGVLNLIQKVTGADLSSQINGIDNILKKKHELLDPKNPLAPLNEPKEKAAPAAPAPPNPLQNPALVPAQFPGINGLKVIPKTGGATATTTTGATGISGAQASTSIQPDQNLGNRSDSINSGGKSAITINIGKQIETLEIHAMSAKEGIEEMTGLIREEMRRVFYSLNGLAT